MKIEIEIPDAPPADGQYVPFRVDATVTRSQGSVLSALVRASRQVPGGLRLPDGRVVDSHANALRWLLEAVAERTVAP